MTAHPPCPIAIIGLSALFPGAKNLQAYWQNILNNTYSVREATADWIGPYYDPESQANDRLYNCKGGFIDDLAEFNPVEFGIMPNSVDGGEPVHFLALKLARDALQDAGYLTRSFNRDKTGVILGRGTYVNRAYNSLMQHGLGIDQTLELIRQLLPQLDEDTLQEIRRDLKSTLPPFTAEMAPGLSPNVLTGRIANRFDLNGPNYIVDAACASSLIAVGLAMEELQSGRCDMVLTGGAQASTPPQIHMIFCQLGALSRSEIRPFAACDERSRSACGERSRTAEAGGTLLSEGLGMLVLKRLDDARRDGDRIYAVIRGIGTASDGKALGLLAPRLEGEIFALQRAYENGGVQPDSLDLIEAHGTGIPLGDRTEIQSLTHIFGKRQTQLPTIALGSVKSQIGHCLPAAGAASLIKAALALYHKVLPPTLCDRVNDELELEQTPFYLNTAPRPWIRGTQTPTPLAVSVAEPRRAGVNAFGFGGINAHVILEEYPQEKQPVHLHTEFPSELLVWITRDRQTLLAQLQQTQKILQQCPHISLMALAYSLSRQAGDCQTWGPLRLAIVASDREDALHKVNQSLEKIANPTCDRWQTRNGIYFAIGSQLASRDRVAFLFPGEGSQYPHMLGDLALHFPKIRAWFDFLDATFADTREVKPSQLIFPAPNSLTPEAKAFVDRALYQMDFASEMVFVANLAIYDLLQEFGLQAAAMVGHSSGENSVLIASGMVKLRDGDPWGELAEQMRQLNRIYQELESSDRIAKGSLLAVGASEAQTQSQILQEWAGKVHLAMHNCPNQTILFGSAEAIAAVSQQLQASGAICTPLPFDRAYHTPLFAPVSQAFRQFYNTLNIATPHTTVYSCSLADRFPESAPAIRDAIARQWSSPVRFWDTIETLYQRGIRTFVEVGPNSNLTGFVQDILRDGARGNEQLVLASNDRRRSGISQLQHLLATLTVNGAAVDFGSLYRYRTVDPINLDDPPQPPKPAPLLNLNMPILKLTPALAFRLRSTQASRLRSMQAEKLQLQLQPSSNIDSSSEVASPVASAEKQVETPADPEIDLRADTEPAIATNAASSPPSCNERNQTATDIPEPQPAIQQHFQLMQEFLASQERIATTLFNSPDLGARFPCLGQIVERSDRHLYSVYRVTLERDIYLHDHTLGAPPSTYHRDLLPLPVIPFTLSLETIVEAAVCLAGSDRVAIAVEEVQGHRWLALDGSELKLGIDARLISETNENATAVRVQIFQLESNESNKPLLAFAGTVKLAGASRNAPTAYPRSPEPLPFHLSQPTPSRWRDRDLYTTGMFHGPRFQGVKHLRCWGTEGIEAELVTISTANFFKSYKNAALQIDAGLLDAAGQLVAYWVSERSNMDFHVFPFRVRAFEFYSAPLPANTSVLCRGTMAYVSDRQIDAQFDLFDPQGRIIARILGWQDVFFTVPPRFCQYRLAPQTFYPSQPWIQEQLGVYCRRMDAFDPGFLENAGELLGRVLAHLSFTRSERDFWYALPTGRRRRSWLLGRIAAKDCIRAWAQQQFQLSLAPVDIEILPNAAGQPVVRCPQLAERSRAACSERSRAVLPGISIAHDGDFAMAALVPPPQSVGIDLQKLDSVRMEDVVPLAFSSRERQRWGLDDPKTAIALWCAKEAAAKAAGTGLQGNPQAWQISEYTGDRAIVIHSDRSFSVRLAWQDKWAVALCSWLPASSELSPQQMLV